MNAERLLKLADHLESGKLGHDKFDFGVIHIQRGCGSEGCALGECPFVWPKEFSKLHDDPYSDEDTQLFEEAERFFEITMQECDHLFMPTDQRPAKFGGAYLDQNASAAQVAANIQAFVSVKLKNNE